jgi:hypothetical protein
VSAARHGNSLSNPAISASLHCGNDELRPFLHAARPP